MNKIYDIRLVQNHDGFWYIRQDNGPESILFQTPEEALLELARGFHYIRTSTEAQNREREVSA